MILQFGRKGKGFAGHWQCLSPSAQQSFSAFCSPADLQAAKHYHLCLFLKRAGITCEGEQASAFYPGSSRMEEITMAAVLLSAKPLFNHFHYIPAPQLHSFPLKWQLYCRLAARYRYLVQKHLTEVALNPIKTLPCKISATGSRLVQDRCGHGLWVWCQFTQLMHYLPLSSNRVWGFFSLSVPLFSEPQQGISSWVRHLRS